MENKFAQQSQELEIDLKEVFHELLKNIWFIVLITAITTISALIISMFFIEPEYTSNTSIYVLNKQQKESANNLTYSDLQTATQLTGDYEILIKSRYVMETVISNLNLDMSVKKLSNSISVSVPEKTRIIKISVSNKDPYATKAIANEVREVASKQILEIMNMDAVNLVDEAHLPMAPSSPNVRKNTLIGFAVGFLLSCAFIVVLFISNDKIKTPEDVERYLKLSVLGVIPQKQTETNKKKKKSLRKSKRNK